MTRSPLPASLLACAIEEANAVEDVRLFGVANARELRARLVARFSRNKRMAAPSAVDWDAFGEADRFWPDLEKASIEAALASVTFMETVIFLDGSSAHAYEARSYAARAIAIELYPGHDTYLFDASFAWCVVLGHEDFVGLWR